MPLMKDASGEHRNTTVFATSSGSPTRPARWKGAATLSVFSRLFLVSSTMIALHVQPGDTALTRMPSGARSIAWLRVSCRIAAFETG